MLDALKKLNGLDIQKALDETLAKHGLGQYVEYARYLAKDAPAPNDATHFLSLSSAATGEKVEIALKAKTDLYGTLADIALKLL